MTLSFRNGINGMRAYTERFTDGTNLGKSMSVLNSGVFNIKFGIG